jgi:hypothetical protein
MKKEIRLNAFDMNCVGHIQHGMWTHPRDRSAEYNTIQYWQDLARLAWISTERERSRVDLTQRARRGYSTRRKGRPFHQGTATGLLNSPEARTIGRWARRWNRTVTSSWVMVTLAGMSIRSRKIWRA